jgi:hypothetical protein
MKKTTKTKENKMSLQTTVPAGFTKKEISGGLYFQSASNWKKVGQTGRMVHGTYAGRLEADKFGKENYKFIALSAGTTITADGETKDFSIGDTIIVNESGGLNAKMDGIAEGDEVVLDYAGAVKMTKGPFAGKSAHQYDLYVKNSN